MSTASDGLEAIIDKLVDNPNDKMAIKVAIADYAITNRQQAALKARINQIDLIMASSEIADCEFGHSHADFLEDIKKQLPADHQSLVLKKNTCLCDCHLFIGEPYQPEHCTDCDEHHN